MPLLRSTDQSQQSLEEFYTELTNFTESEDKEIGFAMLKFVQMVNESFKETNVWGLTSHYHLILISSPRAESDWCIKVIGIREEYQFEWSETNKLEQVPHKASAGSLLAAKECLMKAMRQCGCWEDNTELAELTT